jgi:hypothetical protein
MSHPQAMRMRSSKKATGRFDLIGLIQANQDGL